jgi:hypothetical protein
LTKQILSCRLISRKKNGGEMNLKSPKESETYLIETIKGNIDGLSLQEAFDVENRNDIFFGPETNAFYVLLDNIKSGRIEFNDITGKFVSR